MLGSVHPYNLSQWAARRGRGVIDTSVVIALHQIATDDLPDELAITAVTLGELAAGPLTTDDPIERARRQDRLPRTEATFDPLPFDAAAARAYGRNPDDPAHLGDLEVVAILTG